MCLEDERLQRLKKNDKSKKEGAKELIGCSIMNLNAVAPMAIRTFVPIESVREPWALHKLRVRSQEERSPKTGTWRRWGRGSRQDHS